eukprot:GHVP01054240.1.p1 GENE.GHVP01054240.1~~GHVP01054240.1.p1  ORF type:complete len:605 (+),score=89.05 GHVP01054240.1:30-1844(+)
MTCLGKYEDLFPTEVNLIREWRYETALELLSKYPKPKKGLHYLTAWCNYRLGNLEKAITELNQEVEKENKECSVLYGMLYMRKKDYRLAEESYLKILSFSEERKADVLHNVMIAQIIQEKWESAIKTINSFDEKQRKQKSLRNTLFFLYIMEDKTGEAYSLGKKILDESICHFNDHDIEKMEEAKRGVAKLMIENLMKEEKIQFFLDEYELYKSIIKDDVYMNEIYAKCLFLSNDYEKAYTILLDLIKTSPMSEVFLDMGLKCFLKKSRIDSVNNEVLEDYRKEIFTNFPPCFLTITYFCLKKITPECMLFRMYFIKILEYLSRCKSYAGFDMMKCFLNDYNNIMLFIEVIKEFENKDCIVTKYFYAKCLFHLEGYNECENICQEILSVNNNDMNVTILLSSVYKYTNRGEEGEKLLSDLLSVFPGETFITIEYSRLLIHNGKIFEGMMVGNKRRKLFGIDYRMAELEFTQAFWMYEELGDLFTRTGVIEKAIEMFEKITLFFNEKTQHSDVILKLIQNGFLESAIRMANEKRYVYMNSVYLRTLKKLNEIYLSKVESNQPLLDDSLLEKLKLLLVQNRSALQEFAKDSKEVADIYLRIANIIV